VILIAVSPTAAGGLALGSVLCLALTLGLFLAVRRGSRQPCHCFGSSSEPLGYHHVARNALLLALASTGLACSVAAGGRSAGAAEVTLAAIGGLAAAMLFIFFVDIAALLRAGMPGMAPAQQAGNP
jgi:hypothetical protein